MNLNQLYYFQTIARLQHFSRAAEKLHISQPSLSYAMSSLEKELNTQLFEKHGRNVVLTKYGRLFLEHVNLSIEELENGKLQLQKYTSSEQGQIDIGYVYPLAPRYIPKMARSFLSDSENEHVNFTFYQGITSSLIEGLKSEKYDVVFCSLATDEPEITFVPILQHSLSIVVPSDHPLAKYDCLPLTALADYPLVTYHKATGLGQLIRRAFNQNNLTPHIICEAEGELAIYGLVSEGFGVALVAEIPEIHDYQVKSIKVNDDCCKRYIQMAYLTNRFQPAALKRFIKYVKESNFQL